MGTETVRLSGSDTCIEVFIDGDKVFDGSASELRFVLDQHRRLMDYIDGVAEDGHGHAEADLYVIRGD